MPPLVVGNWKMNLAAGEAIRLAGAIAREAAAEAEIVLCPPAVWLVPVASQLAGSAIALGGQDCHQAGQGAHTGDIAARQLADAGCSHVILGHSERRANHGETDAQVAAKVSAAHDAGLVAIVCVGETAGQRAGGHALSTVETQLRGSLPAGCDTRNTVIAYEPVWAIGSGAAASLDDIAAMHLHVGSVVGAHSDRLAGCRILYGGSVKPENAREILALDGVNGALVGGASLAAEDFLAIARAV